MSGNGLIKQYVRGCIVWPGQPGGEDLVAIRAQYAKPSFNLDCVKIFVDGVPTESHTGGMLENYHDIHADGNDNRPAKGMLMIQQEALDQAVTRFDAQGLSVKFHAAGDAAVRAAIDAVASAHRTNGYGGPMHAVGHSTFVAEADILRVREVQMAFEFSPYIWYPTPIASVDILKAVGQDRMRRWVPIREAVETGALTVAGSDWPVVPSVNPWLGMETMVTRRKPGGSDDALGEAEKVSLEQAFKLFTIGGARLIGRSDKIGTIEVGKQADLIVTDINPFEVAITEVHKTKVQKTYINGTIVFDIDHPPRLTVQ
jgi:predicted amidohydrolase YtcJ